MRTGQTTLVSQPKRVYWDSCAWIGYINREQEKSAALQEIWLQRQDGIIEIWTSTYSYVEVIYGLNDIGDPYPPKENDAIVFSLLESTNVERVQLDVEVAKLARDLKRNHHPILKKRPDSIHLATAIYWNCEELHTWDGSDLLPLNEKILRRDGIALKIVAPKPKSQKILNGELPLFAPPPLPPAQPFPAAAPPISSVPIKESPNEQGNP